ncbi:MAG TPA: hypothetical protein VHQ21_20055, partial [Rhodanobacteraceae bacterium]|nr:hypothetical protein [Rhodanobacteraceae bacterium]
TQPPSHEEVQQLLASFEGSTPGPWEVVKNFSNGCESCPTVNSGVKIIADCHGAPYLGFTQTNPNARLIAAAPRMAAMLESLLTDNVRQSAEIERLRDYQVTLVERIAALEKALRDLVESERYEHGGDHFDHECPICVDMAAAEAALNPQCSGTATGRED